MAIAPVFKETYDRYVAQISQIDLARIAAQVGTDYQEGRLKLPLYDEPYWVGAGGIRDTRGRVPALAVAVILSRYLLMWSGAPAVIDGLKAYKDFKEAAPLVHYFANAVQGRIARHFSGQSMALERACLRLGGRPYDAALSYAVKFQFQGLPWMPVYLLFNDAEEGFEAQCALLFQRNADRFLDMESLAMLGGVLADRLTGP